MKYIMLILLFTLPQLVMASAGVADVAGDDPGLFIFMVAIMLAFMGMIAAGLMIFAILVCAILLMIWAGIMSVSFITGWYHKSVGKGINTFFKLSMVAVGGLLAVLLLLIMSLLHLSLVSSTSFCLIILAAGAIAGWICGYAIRKVAKVLLGKVLIGK